MSAASLGRTRPERIESAQPRVGAGILPRVDPWTTAGGGEAEDGITPLWHTEPPRLLRAAQALRCRSRTSPSTRQKIKYRNRSNTPGSCPTSDHGWSATPARLLAPHRVGAARGYGDPVDPQQGAVRVTNALPRATSTAWARLGDVVVSTSMASRTSQNTVVMPIPNPIPNPIARSL